MVEKIRSTHFRWRIPKGSRSAITLIGALLCLFTQPVQATHGTFAAGDVFVSKKDGIVQWRHPDGTLNKVLLNSVPGHAEGMGFDAAGNLYVNHWCADPTCFTGNSVERFNTSGASIGTFGSRYNCNPTSIDFDAAGNVYIGQADCTGQILKFDAAGQFVASFAPVPDNRGSFWIDLASDDCTVFYTSQSLNVKRFNVCTNLQLPNFNVIPLPDFATSLRLLPDGGALVATQSVIVRLNASGQQVQTYGVTEPTIWLGLDIVGDGTFWAVNHFTDNVFKFDIASGAVLGGLNAGPGFTAKAVAVKPVPPPAPPPQLAAQPSINVSDLKITRADQQSAEGWFTIANTSGGGQAVQIERVQMAWQWIGQGGRRETCRSVTFRMTDRATGAPVGPGTVIPGNTEITVDYSIRCDHGPSFLAHEIKNFVSIKLVGRDKIFGSSGSFRLF